MKEKEVSKVIISFATAEALNEEDVELRVWHSGNVVTGEALCGFRGVWAGAGLLVTCEDCLKLMEKK